MWVQHKSKEQGCQNMLDPQLSSVLLALRDLPCNTMSTAPGASRVSTSCRNIDSGRTCGWILCRQCQQIVPAVLSVRRRRPRLSFLTRFYKNLSGHPILPNLWLLFTLVSCMHTSAQLIYTGACTF